METPKIRVMIVAQNASAQFGGEAFLPLHYFRLLRSRNIETWLVAHDRTRTELQALCPEDCDRMYFAADTWLHRLLGSWGSFLPVRVEYATTGMLNHLYTQIIQRRIVRQLIREHKINIVHEPMPVSPKTPSLIFDVGAPVIIGPLNGGMDYPPAFRSHQNQLVELAVTVSRRFSNLFNRIFPGKIKAQTLLVANERTKQALPVGVRGNIIELVENGVDLSVWHPVDLGSKEPNKRVQFVFVGRLVDWKAVDLLLEAFGPVAAETGALLEIVGDGVMRQELEALTARLELVGNVMFMGWLPQEECAVKLQQADVLVLPSLLECGGAAVLEAMAMGLPIIATNWGGPTDYVDSACGILIEPVSREALVNELTNAMLKLAQSPDLRLRMGRAGQERVLKYFDWERKIDQIIEIYQQTTAI